jgi:hypothetical protein
MQAVRWLSSALRPAVIARRALPQQSPNWATGLRQSRIALTDKVCLSASNGHAGFAMMLDRNRHSEKA